MVLIRIKRTKFLAADLISLHPDSQISCASLWERFESHSGAKRVSFLIPQRLQCITMSTPSTEKPLERL